ncbi:MAG: bifunctional methylenetetrahydrofolate dehydrogenase/methenyltetrahydrofolate cyclohydrolase FolD [Legionellaceae bacterium]|nr:bifunctional methylenetetrahydrofolate dehydrogenase/methenyltetrahydrofolate cyclohydrolase FolD [Legionellaceae bacterium]
MAALILDGKTLANDEKQKLTLEVARFTQQWQCAPGLAVILVGSDPASEIYVNHKRRACQEVGMLSTYLHFPESVSESDLLHSIHELNQRQDIHGILVQLPLPPHINKDVIINSINPSKDVDGFHPLNMGRLLLEQPCLSPCTPKGIMRLLQAYHIDPQGKHAVIVGTSHIVGRPMGLELLAAGATISYCHRRTQNLEQMVRIADILVVAIGNYQVISADWFHSQQVIIDIGINRLPNRQICGDVPFDAARKIVRAITPVPGGVGPMTIVSLLDNCLRAAIEQQQN